MPNSSGELNYNFLLNWLLHLRIFVKGYEYKFVDVTLDPEYLPPFAPDASFKVSIIQYDRKKSFFNIEVFGKISQKRGNKANTKG